MSTEESSSESGARRDTSVETETKVLSLISPEDETPSEPETATNSPSSPEDETTNPETSADPETTLDSVSSQNDKTTSNTERYPELGTT
ncbi:hypothetical protein HNY73_005005 [Argiope bruennichi]|uniref:Uncharacterized protein n=1 Tax=Argiope bruennichi TaxID=94029 RepID=A0A8T0FVF5_ARGBR|nr:hypothetical protein HNY73_005005 [Argiope bruennichi]